MTKIKKTKKFLIGAGLFVGLMSFQAQATISAPVSAWIVISSGDVAGWDDTSFDVVEQSFMSSNGVYPKHLVSPVYIPGETMDMNQRLVDINVASCSKITKQTWDDKANGSHYLKFIELDLSNCGRMGHNKDFIRVLKRAIDKNFRELRSIKMTADGEVVFS